MERIHFVDIPSPLGTIWAAATDRGLFQLDIARPKEAFLKSAEKRIKGKPEYEPEHFDPLKEMLKSYFDGRRVDFDLPLDLRGTEFQRSIWRAIRRIPYGKLSSYGRLAAEAGRPRAVRAAGNAVGDNPLSLVVPCHRVIRSNGGLGGFGGGLDMKRYLLRLEGVLPGVKRDELTAVEKAYPKSRDELLRYFFE